MVAVDYYLQDTVIFMNDAWEQFNFKVLHEEDHRHHHKHVNPAKFLGK